MAGWRRVVGLAALFAGMGIVAFAAPAEQERQKQSPEEQAKLTKAAATLVGKYVARELSLGPEETKKFVKTYVAEREAAEKRSAKAREAGDREASMAVFRENQKGLQGVLEANLNADQIKKAESILGTGGGRRGMFGGLERSASALLRSKVAENNVEKALPVLIKHQQEQAALFAKARSGEIAREEIGTKLQELREKTTKELAPIIGEEAANAWQKGTGFGGRRGAQRGRGAPGGAQPRQ